MAERVILVGVQRKTRDAERASRLEDSLEELGRLVETAGGTVAGRLVQRMDRFHPAYLIGPGKVEELKSMASGAGAPTIVFDDDLSPAQQRNLEEEVGTKILDRTRLILDIFARRARTREGILQVELAQLSYLLPRLTGKGAHLSQQVGGIGTRGPGERKLEVDRRRIRDRIARLKGAIDRIQGERDLQRQRRLAVPFPVVAIVGYTNAGKSTLLNALVRLRGLGGESRPVYADDKLFATLDPTTRRVRLPSGGWVLATDTVGFVQKLPHALVASFRATLEEILHADCLIHVMDASSPHRRSQAEAVSRVLEELGAGDLPIVPALNKSDLVPAGRLRPLRVREPEGLLVSALKGEGIDELLRAVEAVLARRWHLREILVAPGQMGRLDALYRSAQVVGRHSLASGERIRLRVTDENWKRLKSLFAPEGK